MTKQPNDKQDIKELLLDNIIQTAFKIKCEYAKERRERQERKNKIKVITINKGANND